MVSARTAEMALTALAEVWRLGHRNGGVSATVREQWRAAFRELQAASVDGSELAGEHPVMEQFEVISTAEAASRLGVGERRIRQLLTSGQLPGSKIGRTWFVRWDEEIEWQRNTRSSPRT